jgi:hypothetical protein
MPHIAARYVLSRAPTVGWGVEMLSAPDARELSFLLTALDYGKCMVYVTGSR